MAINPLDALRHHNFACQLNNSGEQGGPWLPIVDPPVGARTWTSPVRHLRSFEASTCIGGCHLRRDAPSRRLFSLLECTFVDGEAALNTWIALLRAVNVTGRNKLPMKQLVASMEAAGFVSVRTY